MDILKNTYESRGGKADVSWLSPETAAKARRFHETVPGYAPTALKSLPDLADQCGVGELLVKDESSRFGLKAFKGLGGIYALGLEAAKVLGIRQPTFAQLTKPEAKEQLKHTVFATATDGNHGKGVAWAANLLGCEARVYMPAGSSPLRAQAIRDAGQAQVTVTDWNYDDTVNYVSRLAREKGWCLVQDTSWAGYEEVPRHIMQGYTTMAEGALEEMGGEIPTHVFLQAGVGAMAGAVTGYLAAKYGDRMPKIVYVEPYEAACIYESLTAGDGRPHTAKGNGETIMAGLNCGSPCTVAWPILRDYGSFAVACGDETARRGMRTLARQGIVSGESGASAFGAFLELAGAPAYRKALGIDEHSRILFFSTEGDTDPESYQRIVSTD